jgi:hypothetical protein
MDQTLPDRYDNGNVVDRNARSIARVGHMGGRHRAVEFAPYVERPYSRYQPRHARAET